MQTRPIPKGTNLADSETRHRWRRLRATAGAAKRRRRAKMLVAAENPVIVVSRAARTQKGMDLLIELAELLQAAVIDQHRRMNFPARHPLNMTLVSEPAARPIPVPASLNADLVLGLEPSDFYYTVRRLMAGSNPPKLISISSLDLFHKSNFLNDVQQYQVTST